MTGVAYPAGWKIELLSKTHRRKPFCSGQPEVDAWLHSNALQSQSKHLTATKILVDSTSTVAGFYTLATSQVDFSDLPPTIVKRLPNRALPVAVIAWLGVSRDFQGRGIGKRILATALGDCHEASKTFAFVAVILDCIDDRARQFYEQFDFKSVPGHPRKLYLSFKLLEAMVNENKGQ